MRSRMPDQTAGEQSPIVTAGEVFSDGTILELVRDTSDPTQSALLRWDGANATIARRVEQNGRVYVPVTAEPNIFEGLRLPSGIAPYGSTRELFTAVTSIFTMYCGLPTRYAELTAASLISTFFVDCLRLAPCLFIVGPAKIEATRFLRLYGNLCRHPLLLTDPDVAGLTSLVARLHPTVILYQSELTSPVVRFLRASQRPDFHVVRNGKPLDLFCAKAIYLEHCVPPEWAGDVVEIPVVPVRSKLPEWGLDAERDVAETLQAKLLAYRLTNRNCVAKSSYDVPESTINASELARGLGSCIVEDEELRNRIMGHLRPQDQVARVERAWQLESLVIEALLFVCHQGPDDSVTVGYVTKLVNGILEARGEITRFKPRKVGPRLAALKILTERDGNGYGFRLFNETRERIHELAQAFDVPSVQDGVRRCEYCPAKGVKLLDGSAG
jgi:hypothetical protein